MSGVLCYRRSVEPVAAPATRPYEGTPEEWTEAHRERCLKVPKVLTKKAVGDWVKYIYRTTRNMYCTSDSPCDGCVEWARRRVDAKGGRDDV